MCHFTQHHDFSIALEHFEACVQQMDAVEQGLQFGGFVYYVYRCSDLAAVVQQTGDF